MRHFLLTLIVATLLAGCATREKTADDSKLRVMTYNIHHGEGTDGKIDLERIAKLITDNKVDLVALQEVDRNTERTGHRDMPAEFSRLTGMTNAFGPNLDLQGGQYGNAILSRYPITAVTNHHLPKIVPGEQRGLLQATIQTPRGTMTFCSVHLDHRKPEEDRLASVEAITKALSKMQTPLLIAGDFNARPESKTYQNMILNYRDSAGDQAANTIPSEKPAHRIDYIWARNTSAWLSSSKVLQSNASDHLPVITEFLPDWGRRLPNPYMEEAYWRNFKAATH